MTSSILLYNVIFGTGVNHVYGMFAVASFVVLKLFTQYLIYNQVKYKDDGRDVVTVFDFISIHVTFSVINAWMTY
jgi:hypothetical protein